MNTEELAQPVSPVIEAETMASKWKKSSTRWAKDIKIAYLTNPAAKRDFRTQFRGNRAVPIFTLAVLVMALITLFLYWTVAKQGMGPEEIQEKLLTFCAVIFAIMAVCITLITPVLAASALLAERQRRSLDLVFASPIKPQTYLLGKLIASYRYVWVFMALSLPFTAMSLIMGGGSWWNILECYALLSLQGLLFTSIGLYFAALIEKTVSALIYTYLTVFALIYAAGIFAMQILSSVGAQPFQGGPATFMASLVPPFVGYAAGTYTSILGFDVPNILIAGGIILFFVSTVLTSAAGLLSPMHGSNQRSLRLKAGFIFAVLSGVLGYLSFDGVTKQFPILGLTTLATIVPLVFFVPFLACYGTDGERRLGHNKLFALKDVFGKSVAGTLPFIYALIGVTGVSGAVGALAAHKSLPITFFADLFYAFGLWTLVWATARFGSSFRTSLRAARTLQILSLLAILGVPLPYFVIASIDSHYDNAIFPQIWDKYFLSPMMGSANALAAVIHGLILMILGVGIAAWSEKNYAKRVEKEKLAKMATEVPLSPTPLLFGLQDRVVTENTVQNLSQGA